MQKEKYIEERKSLVESEILRFQRSKKLQLRLYHTFFKGKNYVQLREWFLSKFTNEDGEEIYLPGRRGISFSEEEFEDVIAALDVIKQNNLMKQEHESKSGIECKYVPLTEEMIAKELEREKRRKEKAEENEAKKKERELKKSLKNKTSV